MGSGPFEGQEERGGLQWGQECGLRFRDIGETDSIVMPLSACVCACPGLWGCIDYIWGLVVVGGGKCWN